MKVVVINEELYNAKVREVELDLTHQGGTYKFGYRDAYFSGDVSIETDEGWKTFSGEHGANDYEDEYGFQIVKEYVREDAEDKYWNAVTTWNERHSY